MNVTNQNSFFDFELKKEVILDDEFCLVSIFRYINLRRNLFRLETRGKNSDSCFFFFSKQARRERKKIIGGRSKVIVNKIDVPV